MKEETHKIRQITEPQAVIEGAGVRLLRSFGPTRANLYDLFLLFDHFAFNDPLEGPIAGFPTHPHRGIETVTYMLEGNVRHWDSLGNVGIIGPGAVQWMTSGRGIMHEEMPKRGQNDSVNGFQLWVNLPAALKMDQPRYQEVEAASIPTVQAEGAEVRIVAGEYGGVQGPVNEIAAKPIYMDVTLQPKMEFRLPIPEGHSLIAYLFEGQASFGEGLGQGSVEALRMLIFEQGNCLKVRTGSGQHARFLLFSGAPFGEPIVPYGPFVMNTEAEIKQAFVELRNGSFVTP